MSDELTFKNVILSAFSGNDDAGSQPADFTIHAVTGERYGIVKDASGSMVGYTVGLRVLPEKSPGRPKADGHRVAVYIAYMLGIDGGMNPTEAQDYAIVATRRNERPTATENSRRSLRNVLTHKRTEHLVAGLKRLSIRDPEHNYNAIGLLLREGFHMEKQGHRLVIGGTGWAWRYGEKNATFGTVTYCTPEDKIFNFTDRPG